MRKIFSVLVLLNLFVASSYAQAPQSFKYQAVVRNVTGNILANQAISMKIAIHNGVTTGPIVFSETFSVSTNAYGLVNLEIGKGNLFSGNFNTIDWSAGPYFIETAVDASGGNSYTQLGISQLLSVPYALYSSKANHADISYTVKNCTDYLSTNKRGVEVSTKDSIIVPLTGTYMIIYSGKVLDNNTYNITTGVDYDNIAQTYLYNSTEKTYPLDNLDAIARYTINTPNASYYGYISLPFSTSGIAALKAGDVLRPIAYMNSTGKHLL